MYKLIFADDESLVRNKISQMVEWESAGFALVGCCANGYELMELMERELPDLVLLDINMPFITGIEAARQIRHSYPHTKIVFLTGYTEFSFARQAVELGAMQYIVKPVAAQELLEVLAAARTALEEEDAHVQKLAQLEQVCEENRRVLQQDLLTQAAASDAIYARVRAQGFHWTEETLFCVAEFGIDAIGSEPVWKKTDETAMLYALCNVAAELAQQKQLGFACIRAGSVVLVGHSTQAENLLVQMQECAASVLHFTAGLLHFTVTAGLGEVCAGCAGILVSLAQARRALALRAAQGGDRLFTAQDLVQGANCHTAVWDAVRYIESAYADPGLSADAVCEHLHISPSYLRALFRRQTGGTLIGFITKVRMERAKALLADETLKTGMIAEQVGYTDPHYFGYCFRRHFGTTPAEMRRSLQP